MGKPIVPRKTRSTNGSGGRPPTEYRASLELTPPSV